MQGVGGALAVEEGQAAAVEFGAEDEGDGEQDGGRAGEVEGPKHLAHAGGRLG